jgi:glucose/arabinose dehydrogenase
MAMTVLPSGQLLAAVNARDAIDGADPKLSDDALPHDTFDRIVLGGDYGWPYCFDDNRPSPEFPDFDCAKTLKPDLLLPPHAAPLGMIMYSGTMLSQLSGRLLIGYHGYRALGHRIVALRVTPRGLPIGQPEDVIRGWDAVAGKHPQGAPVGLAIDADGSVLITEDHNGTLLRLAAAP